MEQRILVTQCADKTGLIANIAKLCFNYNYNIHHQDQFVSGEDSIFYMRSVLDGDFSQADHFLEELAAILPTDAYFALKDKSKPRVAVLVTREPHCLGDILIRSASGALDAQIVMVAGNYDDLRGLTEKFDIPFHHVATADKSKEQYEQELMAIIDSYEVDYIVLAKYMRILSPQMVGHYKLGQVINIHHSFLPAFVGAKPYQQAFDRGVKIIGATAHFVTNNLDEGPIITQNVIPVNHRYTAAIMAQAGRDVERTVLLSALDKVFDHKVFIHGNKTIVF